MPPSYRQKPTTLSHVDDETYAEWIDSALAYRIYKFLRQLTIQRARIAEAEAEYLIRHSNAAHDLLILDTETYYTIAHDLLKLVAKQLPKQKKASFERDPTYKRFCAIRSHLVRHAHDKEDGDPFAHFAISKDLGILLKVGSGLRRLKDGDPGFRKNDADLIKLAREYCFMRVGRPQRVGKSSSVNSRDDG